MTLPKFYIDNVSVLRSDTLVVRGNQVSDIIGNSAIGIQVLNVVNLRAKNNKVVRIRSPINDATGYDIQTVDDAVLVYNTASRTNVGFYLDAVTTLEVYNLTAHLCDRCIWTESDGTFRNISFSAYQGYDIYKKANGFYAPNANIDIDYVLYAGLANLVEASLSTITGSTVNEKQILYLDEANDDLTPDYISEQVNTGTANPVGITLPDISGIDSRVSTEQTAKRIYWYDLIDNSFWDVENPQAAEVSFIKAFQSRVLAGSEVANTQVKNDTYIKFAESVERFAELYPMYSRYANQTKFQKRVADMWYAGQDVGATQSYQNAIGGYNLLPSFFKRLEEYEDSWIVNVSYVAYDNWLNGMEDLKYGIGIDVLGTATMNQATSGECYTNTQNCVADIAPVRWFLHNSPQPPGYLIITDSYNEYEQWVLNNMIYNDDYNISIDQVDVDGSAVSPLISTDSIMTTGVGPSAVEFSLLDRMWSENINRYVYYRQGASAGTMPAWTEITDTIGGVLLLDQPYIQFKIDVENVPRKIDYEFIGIGLRLYSSTNDWTRPVPAVPVPPVPPIHHTLIMGGSSVYSWEDGVLTLLVSLPNGEHNSVYMISDTAGYAVGYNDDTNVPVFEIESGGVWSTSPLPVDTNGGSWITVFASSASTVWVGGFRDIFYWNAGVWSANLLAPILTTIYNIWSFEDVAGTVCVGKLGASGKVYVGGTAGFVETQSVVDTLFTSIWGTSVNNYYVVGAKLPPA